MSQFFPETAHLKTDKKKYSENFDSIDWGDLKDKPIEKKPETKKHKTAGLCGEFGMSVFDEKAYKENFDYIRWDKHPSELTDSEIIEETQRLMKEVDESMKDVDHE